MFALLAAAVPGSGAVLLMGNPKSSLWGSSLISPALCHLMLPCSTSLTFTLGRGNPFKVH